MGAWSAVRPHQWLKNSLVALPAVALHKVYVAEILFAFVSFCMAASSMYLLNDLIDIKRDRRHPTKRHRAIASGAISPRTAIIMAGVLMTLAAMFARPLGWYFVIALGLYLAIAGLYTLHLKNVLMLDVVVLAMLYGIRVIAGAEATQIPLSNWLFGFCFFLFLCLALVKRVADIRPPYKADDILPALMTASGFASIVMLALYINYSPELYRYPWMLWGICIVLTYWIGRICLITGRGKMHDDPVVFAATDRASWLCGGITAAIFWAAI